MATCAAGGVGAHTCRHARVQHRRANAAACALVKDVHDLNQANGQARLVAARDALEKRGAGIALGLRARCHDGLPCQHHAQGERPDTDAALGAKRHRGDNAMDRRYFCKTSEGARAPAALDEAMYEATG